MDLIFLLRRVDLRDCIYNEIKETGSGQQTAYRINRIKLDRMTGRELQEEFRSRQRELEVNWTEENKRALFFICVRGYLRVQK